MRFHLAHIVPHPRMHGLNGYKEVIDSLLWGLGALGHEVSYSKNQLVENAQNIVFGAQVVGIDQLKTFPANTICYNFEQMRGTPAQFIRNEMKYAAQNFQIWDYSDTHLPVWAELGSKYPVRHVPVGYAPNLTRIAKAPDQDIDVLIYGMPNEMRLSAFHAVAQAGLRCVFLCGLYGEARDALIARSRTVLNITLYGNNRVFEIVRVSYLLANRKAVVANIDPDTAMEDGVLDAVAATNPQTLQRITAELCMQDDKRAELEERGFQYFKARDIRPILERALELSR